jgi:hypothetical protein
MSEAPHQLSELEKNKQQLVIVAAVVLLLLVLSENHQKQSQFNAVAT